MSRYRREILISIALFLASCAVFGRTCWNGFFTLDDSVYVQGNTHVVRGLNWDNAYWAFTAFYAGNWHPLTWLSLQADSQFLGTNPWGYHLTNVLLHAANGVLLFLTLRLMSGAVGPSAMVGALFAFHPLHVESVAWIAERKDVLSTFFWMATCLAYGCYVSNLEQVSPLKKRRLLRTVTWYLTTLTFFAAGLLAKPMVVSLPFVLLLLDYWPLGRVGAQAQSPDRRKALSLNIAEETAGVSGARRAAFLTAEKIPFLLLVAAVCVLTWHAQSAGDSVRTLDQFSLPSRVACAAWAYGAYLGQALWPANLGPFYPHPADALGRRDVALFLQPSIVAAAIALLLITVIAYVKRRAWPYLFVGWFWYLGTLVPVIGLVQVGIAGKADRYTYIPLVGIFIAVVWAVADVATRRRRTPAWQIAIVAATLAVVLVGCFLCTWTQLGYWRDNVALWDHTLSACGPTATGYHNRGLAFLEKARKAETRGRRFDLEAAEQNFREALRLAPTNTFALHMLARSVEQQGRKKEAVELYRDLTRKQPEWAGPHHELAGILAALGQREQAKAEYEETLRRDPNWAPASYDLGLMFLDEGRIDEAIEYFSLTIKAGLTTPQIYYALGYSLIRAEKFAGAVEPLQQALAADPRNWRWRCMLGLALAESGDSDAAAAQYREAERVKPDWQEILNQEAWLLATDANAAHRSADKALPLARQLCRVTHSRDARFLETLAAAYAEKGDFVHATEIARQALEVAGNPQSELARDIATRLRDYESSRRFRSSGETPPPAK
jgi:tetratricopeptide (TPR) repeat protein